MLTIELKTNFAEIAETMDLFIKTKKVLASYNAEKSVLEERKTYFESSIKQLQENLAQIALEAETFKSEVSSYLVAQRQLKDIKMEIEVLTVLLEEVNEELQHMKIQFFPVLEKALNSDRANVQSQFSISEITKQLKNDYLNTVADLSIKMQSQFNEVSDEIYDIVNDSEVQKVFPNKVDYVFHRDHYKPAFGSMNDVILNKWQMFNATAGAKNS